MTNSQREMADRVASETEFRYRFAGAEFNEATGELTVDGRLTAVEPRPLRLLRELLRRVNEVVTKDELFELVWEGRTTVDNVLPNAVKKLRNALGKEAGARLTNLPRVGYRLAGPVERVVVGQLPTTGALSLSVGDPVPHRLGYVLERQLGVSGHNHVWLAQHTKLNQKRVFKFAVEAERLRSLKREFTLFRALSAELGARPGFAQVIDANFTESPFFLECEYGGQDLLQWADEEDRLKSLSLEGRLLMFVAIAEAIADAHSIGVLHKDIKPTNILVSGAEGLWELRIADFGSGAALDASRLHNLGLSVLGLTITDATAQHGTAGTALYMAPELLSGNASTVQSDVYSLGILLYQFLAGDFRKSLATGWESDIADELLMHDIALATQGDPTKRLTTVSALVERLKKLADRHQEATAAAVIADQLQRQEAQLARARIRRPWFIAAAVVLVVGLISSWLLIARLDATKTQAEASAYRESAVVSFLAKDVLAQSNLWASGGSTPTTMLDILRRASKVAGERFNGQPRLEASVRRHIARAYQRLTNASAANYEFAQAKSLLEKATSESDEELLTIRFEHAQVMFDMSQPDRAMKEFEDASRIAGAQLITGATSLTVAASLAELKSLDHLQEGTKSAISALKLVQKIDAMAHVDVADRVEARRLLATIQQQAGEVEGLRATMSELRLPPLNADRGAALVEAWAQMMQAARLRESRQDLEAERLLLQVRDSLLIAAEPSDWHIGYANSELGHLYRQMAMPNKAIDTFSAAVQNFDKSLGREHQFSRITLVNLSNALNNVEKYQAALAICEQNERWFAENAKRGFYPNFEINFARSLLGVGRPKEALRHTAVFEGPFAERALVDAPHLRYVAQTIAAMAHRKMGNEKKAVDLMSTAKKALTDGGNYPTGLPEVDQTLRQ